MPGGFGVPASPSPSEELDEQLRDEEELEYEMRGGPLEDMDEVEDDMHEAAQELFGEEEETQDLEYDPASDDEESGNGPYAAFLHQGDRAPAGQHWQAGASGDAGVAVNGAQDVPVRVDASAMPDFRARHLGSGITPIIPLFNQGTAPSGTWVSWSEAGDAVRSFRPVRAQAQVIPVKLISPDATRFRHWQTPTEGTQRAACIAALVSLMWTPTSKGFLCAPAF